MDICGSVNNGNAVRQCLLRAEYRNQKIVDRILQIPTTSRLTILASVHKSALTLVSAYHTDASTSNCTRTAVTSCG